MGYIKNIIFDLGGVILDIDYNRTKQAFISLGVKNFDALYSKKKQENFFDDFEKGNLSTENFRDELRGHLPENTTDRDIDNAWNAMLGSVPPSRIEWLKKLRTRYRIFLLSNTNAIHIKAFRAIIEQQFGSDVFEDIFEKCYYSSSIGMRKPDLEIFEHVIRENDFDPAETIFVDDSIQHVEGGKQAGIRSYLLDDDLDVESLISRVLKNTNS